MSEREHPRPPWSALPAPLRDRIEAVLGATVVEARSMPGGWSPGSADRVVTDDGRRAFVKAASAEVTPHTVRLHRREAEVLELLAASGAAPDLIGVVEEAGWFALVESDVEGRPPDPHSESDVNAVLAAVAALPPATAVPEGALRSVGDELEHDAAGWRRLTADDALASVPVTPAEAQALDLLASQHHERLAGPRVIHLDLRFDNALVTENGGARLVDWPGAVVGAAWLDALTIVLEVRRFAGSGTADRYLRHPVLADVAAADIDVFLAVLGAYFFDSARRPPSPGVEAVRAFQRVQGRIVLDWLRERGAV